MAKPGNVCRETGILNVAQYQFIATVSDVIVIPRVVVLYDRHILSGDFALEDFLPVITAYAQ
jgi:hypothetical protein